MVNFVGGKRAAQVSVFYRALVSIDGQLKGVPEALKVPTILTSEQLAQFRARQLGLALVILMFIAQNYTTQSCCRVIC